MDESNELKDLRIHRDAFARSVAEMEARADASPHVLGIERANLANLTKRIAELEGAKQE